MLVVIAACEIGFWVLVVAGLVARYPLRAPRAGAALLATVPLVDVVLLVVTAAHLRSGATATTGHGLAAVYLGFTLAYGHRLVRWADVRFAHRWAGGPAPVVLHGRAHTLRCWGDVLRSGSAALVAAGLLLGLRWWVGDPARTSALDGFLPLLGVVCAVELLWAVSFTVWPKAAPRSGTRAVPAGRGR